MQYHNFEECCAMFNGFIIFHFNGHFQIRIKAKILRVAEQSQQRALPGRKDQQQADGLDDLLPIMYF